MEAVLARLGELGIIPVVKIEQEQHALPLMKALLEGGLPCAEITLRTEAGLGVIRRIAAEFPDVLVGAGTVLSVEQAEQAAAAGAQYIVSPGFDPDVVDWCLLQDVPVVPGAITPTEINMALKKRLHILKFFPAQASGGADMLKALADPYSGVKFIPTGGITAENLPEYLRLGNVHACGGSWMVPAKLIAQHEFGQIAKLTREAVALVQRHTHA
ncbi:MAG: bifunctional 4-hydroxy-2-oxoglutarate aldolase/2-dehydro-3-deoxy-phosphogluconate aldolase [Chloroflexota bacterium]